MTYYPVILVDSSVMIAFYNSADRYHVQVLDFFTSCTSELITTVGCITEVMYFLAPNSRVQNVFLSHLATEVYKCEHLSVEDFARIAELNSQYASLPGDFADLSLVAVSERLNISAMAQSARHRRSLLLIKTSTFIVANHLSACFYRSKLLC